MSAGSRAPSPEVAERLRALPAVDRVADLLDGVARPLAVFAARQAIEAERARLLDGAPAARDAHALAAEAALVAAGAAGRRPREVINATGVIVHTNLGRAPLHPSALTAVAGVARGYSDLEYDLSGGERGSRQAHVEELLCEVTGAEAAMAVNNCAAAVLLAAAALAAGRDVVVSRGQLVEIGGSFRIPDVVAQSGARLVEVGTTNRTRLSDYEAALGPGTGAVMRAHPSNFRTLGFVEEVEIEELCELAGARGVAMIDDVGSGVLAADLAALAEEPPVRRSVAAGCDIVCFSGDKLLGGPQAGLMVGTSEAIGHCRSHPLARALRIDKLSLAALCATLELYADPAAWRDIPVLRMLAAPEADLAARAERLRDALAAAGLECSVERASAKVGGGALPLLELEGPVVAVEPAGPAVDELAAHLRTGAVPLVGRVRDGRLLLDPRTVEEERLDLVAELVAEAARA